jgi:hypothetical protein
MTETLFVFSAIENELNTWLTFLFHQFDSPNLKASSTSVRRKVVGKVHPHLQSGTSG